MSAVSESMNRRLTLGLLASRYGFDLDPAFATEVTVTSIADDIDSVRPGALFMPSMQVDEQQLRQVQALGAYGAVVPHALRGKTDGVQIPLIYAEPTAQQLGKLASEMAGSPSDSLAVFAVVGSNTQTVEQGVRDLADFLHMLGNPVGVISAGNQPSLNRLGDFLQAHWHHGRAAHSDFSSVLMYCILFTLFTIITIRRPHPFRSRLVQISRYTQCAFNIGFTYAGRKHHGDGQ